MRPGLFIAGEWREGAGEEIASIDPSTDEEVWRVASADASDISDAGAAALEAFPGWASTPIAERVEIVGRYGEALQKRAPLLATLIAREMGKARWDAESEVQAMLGKIAISVQAYAERTGARAAETAFGRMELAHRAHGVMGVFGPFNFPGHLPNGHIVPALIAGNTVVFKPSELTPSIAIEMTRAFDEAGLPAGVLNLVCGGKDTGAALLNQEGLAGVLFTGSATTGAMIHRHFAGRPEIILALELGGNNPLIVWPPVDAEAAASLILHSAFLTSGQRCSCARRLIIPVGAEGDSIVEALVALSDRVRVGAWNDNPQPFMGPLVSRHAAHTAKRFEAALTAGGARSLRALKGEGAFVAPAILEVSDPAGVDDAECFAPLLQIWRAHSLDHAIALANATRFGLAGGVVSDDPSVWEQLAPALTVGVLNWNRPTTGAASLLPFGGVKASGSGRPSAYYAADYCAYPVASQIAVRAAAQPTVGLT